MSAKIEKMTPGQMSRFMAICSDYARSGVLWSGKRRTKLEWQNLLISGHAKVSGEPVEIVAGLEGELVSIRESKTRMSVSRGASLIEYATAMATHLGVVLHDPEAESLMAQYA